MIQFGIIKYGIRFKDRTSRHTNRGDSVGSGSEEDGSGADPLYCARCQDHFPDRAELLAHRACCKNRPPEDEDDEEENQQPEDTQGKCTLELARHCQDVSNNNSVEREETEPEPIEDSPQQTQEEERMILDEEKISSNAAAAAVAFPAASHVTLEALQNTKVAVAQFAATALANSENNEAALQELAVLQSTLFTLQHQQVFQLQLIQQLQSQLSDTRPREEDDAGCDEEPEREESVHSRPASPAPMESPSPSPAPSTPPLQPAFPAQPNVSDDPRPPSRTQAQPAAPMCSISSSLASCIITHNDEQPSQEAPNTLEMLQRRAQEVLDSASQGLLAGNLADELAFRKSGKLSPYDSKNGGRNEPFFKHRCRYCGKVFGSDSALQIHIRSHTGERPFKCNVCGSRFTTKGNLKVHFQRHTAKFPHVKMNPNPIPEHLDKYHPPLLAQLSPGPSPGLPHPPQFPPAGHPAHHFPLFRPALDLLRPPPPGLYTPVEQEGPADLSKPAPPSPTPSPRLMEQREDRLSPKREPEPERDSSPQRYPSPIPYDECSEDSKYSVPHEQEGPADLSSKAASPPSSASSIGDPTRDPALYSTLLPRPGSNDNSWESLIEVTRTSETSKLQRLVDNIETKLTDPNQCVVCHRVLSCKSALQMHYRTHTGERPFRCRICGRAFTTKGNLKTHMGVHRMKPPLRALHQCPVCHRKFSNALVLQQHIRLHTGEPTDLTPEQIRAAEVRDFPPLPGFPLSAFPGPGGFPLGLKPSDIEAMREAMMTEEEYPDDDDYPEEDDEEVSKEGTVTSLAALENQVRTITTMASQLSASGLSQSAEDLSETKSQGAPTTRPSSPTEPRSPASPNPSEGSQGGALDLTPRMTAPPSPAFSNFSLMPPGPPPMSCALSSLTSSVLTSTAFSPLGMAVGPGARGNTTCNICYKTFACNSALEIHYRSHTKERPFKCAVCDRGFSTKSSGGAHSDVRGPCTCPHRETPLFSFLPHATALRPPAAGPFFLGNMKQHMLTHKIRDMPQHMFDNSVKSEDGNSEPETRPPSVPTLQPPEQPQIKQEVGMKRPPNDIDLPLPKRPTTGIPPLPLPPPCPSMGLSPPRGPMLSSPGLPSVQQHLQQQREHQQQHPQHPHHQMSHQQSPHHQPPPHHQQSPLHQQQQSQQPPLSNKHLCGVCRKNFSSSSALQIHMRTHTGDKPFRCTVCQKAFTTKGNLKVHMGTHMWSNGASRRGRRMSLELPPRPLPLSPQDSDFLQRRPDLFYPYLPAPFLNGMQQKLNEISVIQQQNGPPHNGGLPSPGKFAGLLGFGPFPPIPPAPTKTEPMCSQPGSPLSDKPASGHSPQPGMTQLAPGEREAIMRELGERERENMLPRMWDLHYERKAASEVGSIGQDDSSPMDVSASGVPHLGQAPRGEGLAA